MRPVLPRLFQALLILAVVAAPASADPKIEGREIVQKMTDQVVATLADKNLGRAAKEAKFRQILGENFDMGTIGSWVMGPPWRAATPQQRAEYLRLFENYIVKVYTGQLSTYSGEKVVVVGAEDDGEGVAVLTNISDPKNDRVIPLKWRLRPAAGKLKVRDVLVENISMSQTQKREFASVYQQRGNTVDGLIAALREKIVELDKQ
jgi:phospholipid transport system substrate-binding protein